MTEIIYDLLYGQSLGRIIVIMIMLIVTWSYLYLAWNKKGVDKKLWTLFNCVIFGGIVLVILVITLLSRGGVFEVELTPFYSLVRAQINPEIYRSMLMNVFLFFPLGLTMPHALPEKWKHNALLTIIFACILSIVIEYLQYHFHLGRAETDDVICNTLGCFIGTISYMISKKMVGKKSQDRL